MKNTFKIESDCLDITRRLKQIDKDYFVVRNCNNGTFELHNNAQAGDSYCLTFPFDTLDERAIDFARKTSVQNSEELFKEMEKENAQLQKQAVKDILNGFLKGGM